MSIEEIDLLKGLKPIRPEDVLSASLKEQQAHHEAAFNLLHQMYHDKDVFTPAVLAKYPEVIDILAVAKLYPPVFR